MVLDQSRERRQRQKFFEEEEHFEYLLKRGLNSIDIADQLIHIMLEVSREGFKNQYPTASDAEIRNLMRAQLDEYEDMKNLRRRRFRG